MKKINRQPGFTLVEILVVVCILAILASLIVPNIVRARVDANDATAQATLKTIANALENYASANTQYPATTTAMIGPTPPYLSTDYFSGGYNGFTYTATLSSYTYSVLATPLGATYGSASFTISTGGVLVRN